MPLFRKNKEAFNTIQPKIKKEQIYYFLHIHKCGGSSLVNYLKSAGLCAYPHSKNGNPSYLFDILPNGKVDSNCWIPFWDWSDQEQTDFYVNGGGNFYVNEWGLPSDFRPIQGITYLTLLRDPVRRVYSHYRELCAHGLNCDFRSFLDDHPFQSSNFITRILCGRKRGNLTESDCERAISRLDSLHGVFILEDQATDGHLKKFFRTKKSFTESRSGSSYGTTEFFEIHPDLRVRVEKQNQLDLKIFDRFRTKAHIRPVPQAPSSAKAITSGILDYQIATAQGMLLRGFSESSRARLELVPESSRSDLWRLLDQLSLMKTKFDGSRFPFSVYERILERIPVTPNLLVGASKAALRERKAETSLRYALLAAGTPDFRFGHLEYVSNLLVKKNKASLALTVWLNCEDLFEKHGDYWYGKACLELKLKKRKRGPKSLERCLSIQPQHKPALELLEKLR